MSRYLRGANGRGTCNFFFMAFYFPSHSCHFVGLVLLQSIMLMTGEVMTATLVCTIPPEANKLFGIL